MEEKKIIITITRQFGSMGRPIAQRMSEKLGMEFYDRDIVEHTAKKLNLPVSTIHEVEESALKIHKNAFSRMAFPLGKGTTEMQDQIFQAQEKIIKKLVEKESCIVVGRCADFILSEEPNSVHIYIYAPYEARIKNCIEKLNLKEDEAKRMIQEVDDARDSYHLNYAGYKPDNKLFKHILVDSSFLDVEGTADYLVSAIKFKFGLN